MVQKGWKCIFDFSSTLKYSEAVGSSFKKTDLKPETVDFVGNESCNDCKFNQQVKLLIKLTLASWVKNCFECF